MKLCNYTRLLLSTIVIASTSAVNFDPATGRTSYPTVKIKMRTNDIENETLTVPLKSVKQLGLDLASANDPVSSLLFDGLDLPPALVILSGSTEFRNEQLFLDADEDEDNVFVYMVEMVEEPKGATRTICNFIPGEDNERDFGKRLDFSVMSGQRKQFNLGTARGVQCAAYFLIGSVDEKIGRRLDISDRVST